VEERRFSAALEADADKELGFSPYGMRFLVWRVQRATPLRSAKVFRRVAQETEQPRKSLNSHVFHSQNCRKPVQKIARNYHLINNLESGDKSI
jgi:hypothetical protein